MSVPYANAQPPRQGMDGFEAQTGSIAAMWAKASEQERTLFGEMHQHYEREVRRLLAEGNEPQNIAHTVHGLVDDSVALTLATANGRKVRCKPGCAGCCSLHVSVTHQEAFLLLVHMQQAGISIDWAKVERQAALTFAQWGAQPAHERRCVFLGAGGLCKVYAHRPAACRKYLVASDPKFCDTNRYPGHEVAIVVPLEGEFAASAALSVLPCGSMARMLVQAKESVDGAA